jgi:hypothetical protein
MKAQNIPINKLTRIYEEGKSITQIAGMFGFSYWMVRDRLLHCRVKIRDRNEPRLIPPGSAKLTPEKAYVLGVVGPGDGWIGKDRIGLNVADLDFADEFDRCTRAVYSLTPSRYEVNDGNPNHRTTYRVVLYSKRVVEDILRYGKLRHFKHHTERVPAQIKKAGLEVQASYLRAFFDSQGSVSLHHKEITGTKKNKLVLEEMGDLLSNFDIYWRIVGPGLFGCWNIAISCRRSIEKFVERVGFTIWRKKQALEKLLKSYKTSRYQTPSMVVDDLVPKMKKLKEIGYSYPRIGRILEVDAKTVWRRLKS